MKYLRWFLLLASALLLYFGWKEELKLIGLPGYMIMSRPFWTTLSTDLGLQLLGIGLIFGLVFCYLSSIIWLKSPASLIDKILLICFVAILIVSGLQFFLALS